MSRTRIERMEANARWLHEEYGVAYPGDWEEVLRNASLKEGGFEELHHAVDAMVDAANAVDSVRNIVWGNHGYVYSTVSPQAQSQAAVREGAGAKLAAQVEQIRTSLYPPNENGDVVRFMYDTGRPNLTSFAAIWLSDAGRWFLTGEGKILPKSMQHEEFVTLLAKPGISNAQAASEWKDI